MTEPVRMPLADAARLLGTTPDALRKKVKRGQVQAVRDNTGRLLVWVDPPAEPGQVSSRPAVVQARQAGQVDGLASQESALVQSLRDHIETLKGLLIAEVERTQIARDEAQGARAEADHAKADQVRMARDVTTMFDEMKALADKHSDLHADRARLQAELEKDRSHIANLQAESADCLTNSPRRVAKRQMSVLIPAVYPSSLSDCTASTEMMQIVSGGRGGGGWSGGEFGRSIATRPVSAAHELGRPAIAVIVSPWPDLDAVSDQDATDGHGCTAAQNAEIIQAHTVEIGIGSGYV